MLDETPRAPLGGVSPARRQSQRYLCARLHALPMDFFTGILQSLADNPLEYAIVLFLYSIATAVILPIPVELGLFLAPSLNVLTKSVIVGAGKATGSLMVFYLGLRVERTIRLWSRHIGFVAWFVDLMERFVAKTDRKSVV